MKDDIGEKTRALLREYITSFEMLEVFLLMRGRPGESWSVASISQRVHIPDDLVGRAMQSLSHNRLIEAEANGTFRYAPGSAELARAAEELAADFSERRAAVLSTMSTNAIERLRSGALTAFADAFILGGKRKDG